jgi:hypothetical protein
MFKVRSTRTNVAVEIEPVCRFWSGSPRPSAREAAPAFGESTLLSMKIRDSQLACYGAVAENAHLPVT